MLRIDENELGLAVNLADRLRYVALLASPPIGAYLLLEGEKSLTR